MLLSGAYNLIQCPTCGYQGQVPMPIVYHDPEHELLLTYFPPELNVPVNQQEQMIGPLIKTGDGIAAHGESAKRIYLSQRPC